MDWLKDYDETAAATEAKATVGGGMIPDGDHRAVIKDASLSEKDKAVKYKLVYPDHGDKEIPRTTFLFNREGEPQFQYVKGDTLTVLPELAAEVEAGRKWLLSELPDYLKQMVGKVIRVRHVTPAGRQYANIYFNGLATNQEVEPTATW